MSLNEYERELVKQPSMARYPCANCAHRREPRVDNEGLASSSIACGFDAYPFHIAQPSEVTRLIPKKRVFGPFGEGHRSHECLAFKLAETSGAE